MAAVEQFTVQQLQNRSDWIREQLGKLQSANLLEQGPCINDVRDMRDNYNSFVGQLVQQKQLNLDAPAQANVLSSMQLLQNIQLSDRPATIKVLQQAKRCIQYCLLGQPGVALNPNQNNESKQLFSAICSNAHLAWSPSAPVDGQSAGQEDDASEREKLIARQQKIIQDAWNKQGNLSEGERRVQSAIAAAQDGRIESGRVFQLIAEGDLGDELARESNENEAKIQVLDQKLGLSNPSPSPSPSLSQQSSAVPPANPAVVIPPPASAGAIFRVLTNLQHDLPAVADKATYAQLPDGSRTLTSNAGAEEYTATFQPSGEVKIEGTKAYTDGLDAVLDVFIKAGVKAVDIDCPKKADGTTDQVRLGEVMAQAIQKGVAPIFKDGNTFLPSAGLLQVILASPTTPQGQEQALAEQYVQTILNSGDDALRRELIDGLNISTQEKVALKNCNHGTKEEIAALAKQLVTAVSASPASNPASQLTTDPSATVKSRSTSNPMPDSRTPPSSQGHASSASSSQTLSSDRSSSLSQQLDPSDPLLWSSPFGSSSRAAT
jgi:hypothetical protein